MAHVGDTGEVGARKRTLQHRLAEWKECRKTVARFDQIIADLRKYGFILLAAMLAAKAFVPLNPPFPPAAAGAGSTAHSGGPTRDEPADPITSQLAARFGISLVTALLVYALFVADRYHQVMLRAAQNRSRELETELGMTLTQSVSNAAENSERDRWGFRIYILFILTNFVASGLMYLASFANPAVMFVFWPHGAMSILSCALTAATVYAVCVHDARTRRWLSYGGVSDGREKEGTA